MRDDDAIIRGAAAIGREAGIHDAGKAYYALQHGLIPASKSGKTWISTRRRIRAVLADFAWPPPAKPSAFKRALVKRRKVLARKR